MNTDTIKHFDWKHATLLVAGLFAITVFGLWAWNTLAELLGGPAAQYKHMLAALILLGIVRWPLQRRAVSHAGR